MKQPSPRNRTKSAEVIALETQIHDLEHKLKQTVSPGFEIAIAKGGYMSLALTVAGVICFFGILIFDKSNKFSGNQFIVLVAILAATMVVFFSFVFGRKFLLSMELSKAKRKLHLASGDKV